ncbi:MAG: ABC transporter ATP-binding protein/permease [Coleofasciculus sp. S288]|nr:ABC transporter ATP-binding protein/permease [Coleofasciculus sp. S288]
MLKYLSKFLYILPAKKISLILLLFSFLLVSVLEVFGIGLIGPFIALANNPDIINQNSWLNWAYEQSGFKLTSQFIGLVGLLVVAIFCIKSFISWKVQVYVFVFSYRQQGLLMRKLMHNYLSAPYSFHLKKNSAHFIQSVVTDTQTFANSVLSTLLTTVANFVVMLSLVVLLCLTNLTLIVVVLGMALPLFILFNRFKDKLVQWGVEAGQANEAMVRIINHGLGGIKETQLIGCGPYFEKQLAEQAQRYATASGGFYAFKLSPRIIVETLLVISLVGFISVYLIFNSNTQSLTSVLGIFALASIRLIPAMSNFMGGMSVLRNSSYVLDKLYADLKELKNLEMEQVPQSGTHLNSGEHLGYKSPVNQIANFKSKIALDAVTYHYPNASENALNEISLTLQKGQSIAFIGKSGAGKTTLVDVILGLLIPDSGDIKVDGNSVYEDIRSWQNLIGYIPQSIFLIDDTIERNIAFGVPDHLIDHQRLNKAIQAAQLMDLVERLPKGIQTMVGDRGVLLSGGQRQRIGIARALYHEREILVLDEATAALDNETESLVTEAMKSLSGTKTMIIIAHRLTTVEHCDCIYLMEKGRIVKSGTYEEVVLGEHLLSGYEQSKN